MLLPAFFPSGLQVKFDQYWNSKICNVHLKDKRLLRNVEVYHH